LVDIEQVKRDLTFSNGAFFSAKAIGVKPGENVDAHFRMYEERGEAIRVPRHYNVPYSVDEEEVQAYETVDARYQGDYTRKRVTLKHRVKFRDDVQREACAKLLASDDDNILTLGCGKGKTVVSLCAAGGGETRAPELQRFPLLVVCHTNALIAQWRERIQEFYGLEDDEIGHVQAKHEDWRGKKVVIAMLHSLVMPKKDLVDKERFWVKPQSDEDMVHHAYRWGLLDEKRLKWYEEALSKTTKEDDPERGEMLMSKIDAWVQRVRPKWYAKNIRGWEDTRDIYQEVPRYSKEFFNYFRLVIFDECHRLGANLFCRAAALFPCERWGLSATVKRADGMDKVFRMHLGKVCYEDTTQALKAKVVFVHTGIQVQEGKYAANIGFRNGWGQRGHAKVNLPRLINDLAADEDRNIMISEFLDARVAQKNIVLVLGNRVKQLYALNAVSSSTSKAVHVGDMKQADRTKALKKKIVFASTQLAKEGLDRPEFNELGILYPVGDDGTIQQMLGRVERALPGKSSATAYVFEDDVGVMHGIAAKMERAVRAQGKDVEHIWPDGRKLEPYELNQLRRRR
jgi:superfamily II DNA or RNA helicase